jgi:hypothetical protein
LSEHPEEQLLAQARAQQHTPDFHAAYRQRQTVEHRLARMMQLGARQARYFGRAKTQLQWTIANPHVRNAARCRVYVSAQ